MPANVYIDGFNLYDSFWGPSGSGLASGIRGRET
jgi:hypothetical protein